MYQHKLTFVQVDGMVLIKSMVPTLSEERHKSTWFSFPHPVTCIHHRCLVLLDPLLSYGLARHSCFIAELCKKFFQRNVPFRTEPIFIFTCVLILVCLINAGSFESGK